MKLTTHFLRCMGMVTLLSSGSVYGQAPVAGRYVGLVNMTSVDPSRPKYKWFRLTHFTVSGDSVWVKQNPVAIYKKDTVWSSSDGGFYYYRGTYSQQGDSILF